MKLPSLRKGIESPEMSPEESYQNEISERIEYNHKNRAGLNRIRKHPIQVLTEKPANILLLTLPIALTIFIGGMLFIFSSYGVQAFLTSTMPDDILVITVLITAFPLAILDFREEQRVRNIERELPNFFRDVAGMNESGMTLPNAIHIVATGEYGNLTRHIRKLDNDMSWNIPFVEAIYSFGKRLETPLANRSVDLIAKASTAGGDVSEVLRAAAVDSYEFVNLETERRNNMLIYVVIVLISFLVFLFVIAVMTGTFLDTMANAGAAVAETGGAGAGAFGASIDMDFYRRLFSHAAMIQGFFSGLVAGQMGEGRAVGGLKYSCIMLIIAWVSFRFFI